MISNNVVIRLMRSSDSQAVVAIVKTNWPNERRALACIELELSDMFSTASYRPTFFVAQLGKDLVGFAGWNWSWHNYDFYELFWGNVLPAWQGVGIGRKLTEARIADIDRVARELPAPVERSHLMLSTHLPGLYARYGFRTAMVLKTWQSDETHLMMRELVHSK